MYTTPKIIGSLDANVVLSEAMGHGGSKGGD